MRPLIAVVFVLLTGALLAGCSGPRTEAPPTVSAGLPVSYYEDALQRGDSVYRVDPDASLVTVYVYREGPLARLGHDHVVADRAVSGLAAWSADATIARADLLLTVATLTVDDPDLREQAGFESEPSADDIAGTRSNMLKSIEADAYPEIAARVTLLRPPPDARVSMELRWHGVTKVYELPIELDRDADRFSASGTFEVLQSDFGIEPFSVFGGALSVSDRLDVSISLRGTRIERIAAAAMLF
ncbi:MAG: YceI family protein [Gammaproteobacteria bacterium]|nr:YceI family protein [Gammaproteobacteria bacterium]